jgi:branched-chain amino acid transport system ATP-binding protein
MTGPATDDAPLLTLERVDASYGMSRVLRGVSLQVRRGEIVSVLGRNGAGRSTLLKAIMGLVPSSGSIVFDGHRVGGLPPYRIARLGVGYVPESREVFRRLSVEKNLELGRQPAADLRDRAGPRWTVADMYRLFPPLEARARTPAGVLSGGEQQMLTLCRTLMGDPDLIIIDEPTEGLAPKIVELVGEYLGRLRERGVSVLLIEQKLTIAMKISDRALVMGHGAIVYDGTPADLLRNERVRKEWLEV